ncbi:putative ADP-ribosylation factor-like protein 5C isoform X3 [Perognathus longimembris pacificus]|uniref:putative ADP-ribosylation factor-like protein 5C isoform X3 n=1 Tax=Perognathus longimembris pacificus TaxID=214514 RepID=UPI00201982B1|nr:putative ADP-ribosylation factor-like protein 5C isoform X3 [Perognathus longimembris pacificus]
MEMKSKWIQESPGLSIAQGAQSGVCILSGQKGRYKRIRLMRQTLRLSGSFPVGLACRQGRGQWATMWVEICSPKRKPHHSWLPFTGQFIILVIDSSDRDRLLTTREELYKMLAHEALRDASVLIFANKQDVKDSMTTAEISQFLSLSAIKDHPWHIQGCCALTGEGLPAGLQWMQSQATAK